MVVQGNAPVTLHVGNAVGDHHHLLCSCQFFQHLEEFWMSILLSRNQQDAPLALQFLLELC